VGSNAMERDPAPSGLCMWTLVDRLPCVCLFIVPMLSGGLSHRVRESAEIRDLELQFHKALAESPSFPFPESYRCLGRKIPEFVSVGRENDR